MVSITGNVEKVPMQGLEDRLRITPDGKAHLIGMKCRSCGEVTFSKAIFCPNCNSGNTEDIALSTKGKIWSYTIAHVSYGSSIGLTPPYAIAFVELPEGAFIYTAVVGCDPSEVKIGMEVELDLLATGRKSGDKEEVAYVFKPVKLAGKSLGG